MKNRNEGFHLFDEGCREAELRAKYPRTWWVGGIKKRTGIRVGVVLATVLGGALLSSSSQDKEINPQANKREGGVATTIQAEKEKILKSITPKITNVSPVIVEPK